MPAVRATHTVEDVLDYHAAGMHVEKGDLVIKRDGTAWIGDTQIGLVAGLECQGVHNTNRRSDQRIKFDIYVMGEE